jgi:hypothetical protein
VSCFGRLNALSALVLSFFATRLHLILGLPLVASVSVPLCKKDARSYRFYRWRSIALKNNCTSPLFDVVQNMLIKLIQLNTFIYLSSKKMRKKLS